MKSSAKWFLAIAAAAAGMAGGGALADKVLLVNNNYTDGQPTSLGHNGYSTFWAAQVAVMDKDSTTIMATSADTDVDLPTFSDDIVTKDYRTRLVGADGNRIDACGVNLIVGDASADVESADVSVSYADNINAIRFGNVTGTAVLSIGHTGSDENSGIATFDLTGAVIGDARITVSNSFVGTLKLADQAGSCGTLTIRNSTIGAIAGDTGYVALAVCAEDFPGYGDYIIAGDAGGFSGSIIVKGAGETSIAVGGPSAVLGGRLYSLAISSGHLVLSVAAAQAADPVPYLDPTTHTTNLCTDYTLYTGQTTLDDGWWVVADSATNSFRIVVSGDVHIILVDGKTLTASKGLNVGVDGAITNSLTIWAQSDGEGMGALTTTDRSAGAGIGGNDGQGGGTVTVNGGAVTATGHYGAGIGGGEGGAGGTVTICGGAVTAAGDFNCAGIGGGSGGAGGNVTVTGGTVEATGGGCGAGIGGGGEGAGGTVTICGGAVTATGGYGGAGIGGGLEGAGGTVTICGGAVTATGGGSGAGIGGGGDGAGGTVMVSGGMVTATGVDGGAGIGGGDSGAGGTVMVSGGTVTATGVGEPTITGGGSGAGIGGGRGSSGGMVTVSGGTVTATGGYGGAGIGGGKWVAGIGGGGGTVVITGGTVTAVAGTGAEAIGHGLPDPRFSLDSGTISFYDDAVVFTNALSQTPVSGAEREGACRGTWARVVPGSALNPVPYLDPTDPPNTNKVCRNYTPYDGRTELAAGWWVVADNATVSSRIKVSGDVHLLLVDNRTLTVQKGVNVGVDGSTTNSLTIWAQSDGAGMGALTTGTPNEYCAGIGGNDDQTCGMVTFNGGSVTATGGARGAGVGGGENFGGGTVMVNGGSVTATGGERAAGIGGGNHANGGTVVISSGTVTATGGKWAAGIGGGNVGDGGTITISGGTVNATGKGDGDSAGAGLGGGSWGDGGVIRITGGTVTAVAGNGRNIQAMGHGDNIGYTGSEPLDAGTLALYDDAVVFTNALSQTPIAGAERDDACRGAWARVVPGSALNPVPYLDPTDPPNTNKICRNYTLYDGRTTLDDGWWVVADNVTNYSRITVNANVHLILVDGSTLMASDGINVPSDKRLTIWAQSDNDGMGALNATCGGLGAGIGGNNQRDGGSITINGGRITANGGYKGAGIGGGRDNSGGTVVINAGVVTATGGAGGAGIGGGGALNGNTMAGSGGTVVINGGFVKATGNKQPEGAGGGAGIGGGSHSKNYLNGGAGGNVTINGGTVVAIPAADAEAIGRGASGSTSGSLTLYDAAVVVTDLITQAVVTGGGRIDACRGAWAEVVAGDLAVPYLDPTDDSGPNMTCYAYTPIAGQTELTAGWYVVNSDVTNASRITVIGDVRLILCDGVSLTATKGINVEAGNSLRIYAQSEGNDKGALFAGTTDGADATCDMYNAGIGGGNRQSGGRIIVIGGRITATGGEGGAGIGGGAGGAGGDVTVSGGMVTAACGMNGEAIGHGAGSDESGTLPLLGIKVYASEGAAQPVVKAERNNVCRGTWAKLMVCDQHTYDAHTGACAWCGTGGAPVPYLDPTDETEPNKTCTAYASLTGFETTLTGGWYAVQNDVTIGSRVVVTGDVRLILVDGCTLTAPKGVSVGVCGSTTNSFTVYAQSAGDGMGALTVTAPDDYCAGIGGGDGSAGGGITVNGGMVTAAGGHHAAGVGGGRNGAGGTIIINGGKVTATGGEYGAGVGGGYNDMGDITITGGTITINGGAQVTATGGERGAGIGGGNHADGDTVVISGGTINATGGNWAAGIGGGNVGDGGTITICGGAVNATGKGNGEYAGAGIGGGSWGDGGVISITGCMVTAVVGNGPNTQAIGHGDNFEYTGSEPLDAGALSIPGMKVFASQADMDATPDRPVAEGMREATCRSGWAALAPCDAHGDAEGNGLCDACGASGLPVRYLDPTTHTVNFCGTYTLYTGQDELTNGWYVVADNATVSSRVRVSGDVNLILVDGKTLTASKGVNVAGSDKLTIWAQSDGPGMGALTATGGDYQAGIGGNNGFVFGGVEGAGQAGTIVINGGVVTAKGGDDGAGIGGGWTGAGGTVTINGGAVAAKGGYFSAGIGGGWTGAGGTVVVTGGAVTATGCDGGAGIGGSFVGSGYGGAGGSVTISGGTVTAIAGEYIDSDGGTAPQAIGHGQRATIEGTISFYDDAVVFTNMFSQTPITGAEREGACRGEWAKIVRGSSLQGVPYLDPTTHTTNTCYQYIPYDGRTTLDSGWYVVADSRTVGTRIAVQGDVNLILVDGKTLRAEKGVNVCIDGSTTNSLTIWAQSDGDGMGALTATGGDRQAGIGGDRQAGGTVTVNGGAVTAMGGGSQPAYQAQIGNGTSTTGYLPMYYLYDNSLSTQIFHADELAGAGANIAPMSSLSWYSESTYGYNIQNVSIWMANVADDTVSATTPLGSTMTLVYSGNHQEVVGWNEFVFNQGGFAWDGHSNVRVMVQMNNGDWGSSVKWSCHTASFQASGYAYRDNTPYNAGSESYSLSQSTTRANTLFKSNGGTASAGGIGGGAGGNGGTVTINGGTVTATAGAGAQAIGHGVDATDPGHLDFPGTYCAYSPENATAPVDATNRMDACRGDRVKLTPCNQHAYARYRNNGDDHTRFCRYCDAASVTEDHAYDNYVCPCGAHGPVPYLDPVNHATNLCETYTLYIGQDELTNGWYVVADNATANDRITVSGDVHLILVDGASLTATNGVNVGVDGSTTNSLTIWAQSDGDGMGALTATGDAGNAGIGGDSRQGGGTVTVNGGGVTATGGSLAAGIGGGSYCAGGTVTVNGGSVTATGGTSGAGIGGGSYGAGGTVTVNGGSVTATGGNSGAGIGGGVSRAGGKITITGGTVNSTGGFGGAGIGGGVWGAGGDVVITGGTVTAAAGSGAEAIGHGLYADDEGTLDFPGTYRAYSPETNSVPVLATNRMSACRGERVKLTLCAPHWYADYRNNGADHTRFCRYCGAEGATEAHVYENYICPCGAVAPAAVSNVQAAASSPWDGTVGISFDVTNSPAAMCPDWNRPFLSIVATDNVTGSNYVSSASALSAATAGELEAALAGSNGAHTVTWDFAAQGINLNSTNVTFTVAYLKMPDYCVIDLSGGTNAAHYAVSYLDAEPEGGFTNDLYRTTNLVMRLLAPGTFEMGDSGSTETTEITNAFYCAVFETTQRQWELVKGDRPSWFTNETCYATRPVESVSWNMIRGDSATYNWPNVQDVDSESFVGVLRSKTGLASLDLPTEAQWEYACRAGTTNDFNNGKNMTDRYSCINLNEVARYWWNGGSPDPGNYEDPAQDCEATNGTAVVGSYNPSAWGLYDMHGNVWEWCLNSLGSNRVERGGGWDYNAHGCTSSIRYNRYPSSGLSNGGFRLVRTLSSNLESERSAEAAAGAERAGTVCAGAADAIAINPAYTVTVVGGSTTNMSAVAGETVTVTADEPDPGKAFVEWTSDDGVAFANPDAAETAFTMPATNVTVTAVFADIEIASISNQVYTGSAVEPQLVVTCGGWNPVFGSDYDVSYLNNTNAGTATAIVTMSAPHTGSASRTFEITPKQVTVTAESEEFTYDGQTHYNALYDVVGLVGDDAISAIVTGSITFPRESPVTNVLASYEFTRGLAGNYSVTTRNGELRMANASVAITIAAASGEWTYDGAAHATNAVTVADGALLTDDTLVAAAAGCVTNVSDTAAGNNPVAPGCRVMHGAEDVTGNYVITPVAGTLSILPRAVTFTGVSETRAYTGSEIVITNLVVGNLVAGHAHNVTFSASGTDVGGPYDGTITPAGDVRITDGAATVTANYAVTVANGALTIERDPALAFEVSLADGTFIYDGEGHALQTNATSTAASGATVIEYSKDGASWTNELSSLTATNVADSCAILVRATNQNYANQATNAAALVIAPRAITNATIAAIGTQYYDGQALTPVPSVTDGSPSIITTNDYTVSYSGNNGPGTATVTLTGMNNYEGETFATFQIVPARLTFTVTAGKWGRVLVETNDVALATVGPDATADLAIGYGSSVTATAVPGAGFAVNGGTNSVSFASFTDDASAAFRFMPNPADAAIRWKFSSAVGRYFAQISIPAHAGYGEALGGLSFLFADRTKADGTIYAQLWNAAGRAPEGVLVTDNGVAYRGVALPVSAFAGLADGARALWGVSDATLANARDIVQATERQIGLYVRKRVSPVTGNETEGEVGNFIGFLTWVTDGARWYLPVVEGAANGTVSPQPRRAAAGAAATPSAAGRFAVSRHAYSPKVLGLSSALGLRAEALAASAPAARIAEFGVGDGGSVAGRVEAVAGGEASSSFSSAATVRILSAGSLGGAWAEETGAEVEQATGGFEVPAGAGGARFFRAVIETREVFE